MTATRRYVFALAAFAAIAHAAPASAESPPARPATYQPESGQVGKDVVWIPTQQALVDAMLDMARVTPKDFVMDLGSGDGRLVISAAKRGARALGVEYNPDLVEFAKRAAAQEGVAGRAEFVKADLFETDFSKASVITMFLLPQINLKLRPKLLELKPGTRIVSNTFDMGEWQADATVPLHGSTGCAASWCTGLLWIVPAKVQGTHRLPQGELELVQSFQKLAGTLRVDGQRHPLAGTVSGNEFSFVAGGRNWRGRVRQGRVELVE